MEITRQGPFQLNVFHWHIVDAQSFPVELSDEPTILMSQYGAYGPSQIYSRDDIIDIVKYANLKGNGELRETIESNVKLQR